MIKTKEKKPEILSRSKGDAGHDDEMKEATAEMIKKARARAKREAEAPTYRTVLVAASVGVLIGLLLRR